MLKYTKSAITAAALAAMTLVTTPAEARGYHGGGRGGDDAAIAIGAGVVGIALGAALASDHGDYYDSGYYYPRGYYYNYYPRYRPYYNDYYEYDPYVRAYPHYYWRGGGGWNHGYRGGNGYRGGGRGGHHRY